MQKAEVKEKKIGFFKKIKLSVIDFDKYFIIATEKPIRTLLYLLKLFLIFSIIVTISMTYKISTVFGQVSSYIKTNTPNFYLQDGTFTLEQEDDLVIENNEYTNIKIIMSNETNTTKYNEELEKYDGFLVLLLKNDAIIKDNTNSIKVYDYSQLQGQYGLSEISKDGLIELLGSRTVYITVFFYLLVATFMIYFGSMLIDIIALTLLGFIITRIARMPLKFTAVFAIAAASITLPVILNAIYVVVNTFTGYTIPEFQIMYTIISYIYLIASILIMRSNLIKNKNMIVEEITKMNQENDVNNPQENPDNEEKQNNNENENNTDIDNGLENNNNNERENENNQNKDNKEEKKENKLKERKENNNLGEQGLGES